MPLLKEYQPEKTLLDDAYLGSPENFVKKLSFLSSLAQQERWDYINTSRRQFLILQNYLFYTYERGKQENKIAIAGKNEFMCFNTGLQTIHERDIYAYFIPNRHPQKKPNQDWFLMGFKQSSDKEMQCFEKLPEIADYFTNPSDFIYDKKMDIDIDYEHIIDDNFDRFVDIGLEDKFVISSLLQSGVVKIKDKLKRNYKLAIPQFYTDKTTQESKIQLLLPLYLNNKDVADLALVIDKGRYRYTVKTILPLEWAYVNSRRIIKPDVDWLKINRDNIITEDFENIS